MFNFFVIYITDQTNKDIFRIFNIFKISEIHFRNVKKSISCPCLDQLFLFLWLLFAYLCHSSSAVHVCFLSLTVCRCFALICPENVAVIKSMVLREGHGALRPRCDVKSWRYHVKKSPAVYTNAPWGTDRATRLPHTDTQTQSTETPESTKSSVVEASSWMTRD